MKALDDGNLACGIFFVDLQKAFDTVDHSILLSKLCHYGICGLVNKWFEQYLANHKQFPTCINQWPLHQVLQVLHMSYATKNILGALILFLIYINDLHVEIKHCKVYHFVDATNLLSYH